MARSSRRFQNSACLAPAPSTLLLYCVRPLTRQRGWCLLGLLTGTCAPGQPRLSRTAASLQHPGQHLASIGAH